MAISLNPKTFASSGSRAAELPIIHLAAPPEEAEQLAWDALRRHNLPPRLFRKNGARGMVRVIENDGLFRMEELGVDALRRELGQAAVWGRKSKSWIETRPPLELVRNMLAHPRPPLPVLRRVSTFPFYDGTGRLISARGYDAPSGVFLTHGFADAVRQADKFMDSIPEAIAAIQEAFCDFPLQQPSGWAHLLVLAITPLIRELIDGPVPVFLISKPCSGIGGTLLIQAVTNLVLGEAATLIPTPERRDFAELRRTLVAAIRDQAPIILVDNLEDASSPSLAALVTAPRIRDRRIGSSEFMDVENASVFVLVGNHVAMSPEIARRAVPINLNPQADDQLLKREFRHPDLIAWIRQHRNRLLGALLALVRRWLDSGRPAAQARLASFESWSRIVGGVLQANNVAGFLGNLDFQHAHDSRWGRFLQMWWENFGRQGVSSRELLGLARARGVIDAQDTALTLGRKLSHRVGSVLFEWMIERIGRSDNAGLYRLLPVAGRLSESPLAEQETAEESRDTGFSPIQ